MIMSHGADNLGLICVCSSGFTILVGFLGFDYSNLVGRFEQKKQFA